MTQTKLEFHPYREPNTNCWFCGTNRSVKYRLNDNRLLCNCCVLGAIDYSQPLNDDSFYQYYIQNLRVGDAVFPCYDGKLGRATRCTVVKIESGSVIVEGAFWAKQELTDLRVPFRTSGKKIGMAYTDYNNPDQPTLMQYLGVRDGDFYRLVPPDWFKCLKPEYTQSLGL